MEVVQGQSTRPMVEVGAYLGQVVVVVVVEVPHLARVGVVVVLACQEAVGVGEVLACQVKEVEEEEHRCDLVKEEGVEVGEQVMTPGQVRVGVGVEGAYLHSDQVGEGRVVEGENQELAQEQ